MTGARPAHGRRSNRTLVGVDESLLTSAAAVIVLTPLGVGEDLIPRKQLKQLEIQDDLWVIDIFMDKSW